MKQPQQPQPSSAPQEQGQQRSVVIEEDVSQFSVSPEERKRVILSHLLQRQKYHRNNDPITTVNAGNEKNGGGKERSISNGNASVDRPSLTSLSSSSSNLIPASTTKTTTLRPPATATMWERERCDRTSPASHLRFSEGIYKLPFLYISTENYKEAGRLQKEEEREIVINEEFTSLGKRVWDCSVLVAKWFEKRHKQMIEGGRDESNGKRINVTSDDDKDGKKEANNKKNSSLLQPLPHSTPSTAPLLFHCHRSFQTKEQPQQPFKVLELGAGTGLLSIALAFLGASVISTEYGPILSHLRENCRANGVLVSTDDNDGNDEDENINRSDGNHRKSSPMAWKIPPAGKVKCYELDWYKYQNYSNHNDNAVNDANPQFDLIIITDCTLTPSESNAVLSILKKVYSPSIEIIVGVCMEREGAWPFVNGLKTWIDGDNDDYGGAEDVEDGNKQQKQTQVERVKEQEMDEYYRSDRQAIWRVRPKK